MTISSWLSWPLSQSHAHRGQHLNPASRSKRARFSLEPLEARALLASYTAASVSDLIADITAANTNGGTNTITLTAATTAPYVLTTVDNTTDGATGLPVIAANDNLTVVGAGDTIERSTAVGTPAFRLFDVAAGASLTLQSLTLQGGSATGAGVSAEGGAVYSQGALTLTGVTVQDNQAVGNAGSAGISSSDPATPGGNAFGGGLYVAGGTATFTTATLTSNTAQGGPGGSGSTARNAGVGAYGGTGGNGFGGGLVIAGGTVALSSTTLSANVAQGGPGGKAGYDGIEGAGGNGYGGALEVSGGTASVFSSTLSLNTAEGGSGLVGVLLEADGFGGALQVNGGTVSLTGATLSSNTAQGLSGYGGALQVNSGAVSLTNATLFSNTALGDNNAYIGGYGSGEDGIPYTLSEGGYGDGGALQVNDGTVTLTGATVSSNTAQGGYGYYGGTAIGGALQVSGGTVTLTSAILSSNTAQAGSGFGYGGSANAGALQESGGTLVLATVTLSSNTAQGGNCATGENGYAGNGDGGALQVIGGTVSVTNTTVSSNTAQGGTPSNDGGFGSGGGLYIKSPAIVYLDSFTVAHTSNNTDSTGLNGTSANFDGGYSVLNLYLQPPTVVNAASASPSLVAGTTTSLSVLGSDPDNGSESYLTYTWAVTSAPAGAATPTFSSNGSNTSKNTTATFHHAGTYTFKVTLSDSYHLTADSSVTVTVNQTETSISASPTTASLDWGIRRQFTASARDQFGLAMASQPAFTWTLAAGGAGGSLSPSGLYTAPLANGTDTVCATDSSTNLSGTAAVTVMNSPPTVVTAASASTSPVTGTTTNLTVLGADAAGAASLTYTWAVTSAPAGAATPTFSSNGSNASQNTTATFYRAGTYTFQVTITDPSGLTAVSSVTVTVVQTVTSLSVTPGNVTLADGATQQFTATALDQFGQALTSQPTFTWQVSSAAAARSAAPGCTRPRRKARASSR